MPNRRFILLLLLVLCPTIFYGQYKSIFRGMNQGKTAIHNNRKYSVDKDKNHFKKHLFLTGEAGLDVMNGDNIDFVFSYNGRLGLGYQMSPIVSLKGTVGYGIFDGDYSNHSKTVVESDYLELIMSFRINLSEILYGYNVNRRFNIIPYFGAGQIQSRVLFLHKDGSYLSNGYPNSPGASKGTGINGRIVALTYSFGVEIDMKLSKNVSAYFTMTDFYIDSDRIDGTVIVRSSNDWYLTGNFGLNFKLRKKEKKISTCDYIDRRIFYPNYDDIKKHVFR